MTRSNAGIEHHGTDVRARGLGKMLLLAPSIFVVHFLEEGPGFVDWFNAHVARGITPSLFWRVNLTALAITIAVVGVQWLARTTTSATIVVAWFAFLMLANSVLHIVGSVADRAYMPGAVTAIILYLPFSIAIIVRVVRRRILSVPATVVTAAIGALPMLVHGYLIIFRGSRLF